MRIINLLHFLVNTSSGYAFHNRSHVGEFCALCLRPSAQRGAGDSKFESFQQKMLQRFENEKPPVVRAGRNGDPLVYLSLKHVYKTCIFNGHGRPSLVFLFLFWRLLIILQN